MKVALFGATGGSGNYILNKLLKRGYSVKVLVRNPEKIKSLNNQEIIKGDVLDPNDIDKLILNSDIVISALGQRPDSPNDLLTISINNMIKSMGKYGRKRIIILTGAGVMVDGDKPSIMDRVINFFIKLFAPKRFRDGENMVKRIMKTDLDWTVVRTHLQENKDNGGKETIGLAGTKGHTWKCSRGFIARFIVDNIENSLYIKKAPIISD